MALSSVGRNSNLLERSTLRPSPSLSASQLTLDGMTSSFVSGMSDWHTLTAMTFGSLVYRATKVTVLSAAVQKNLPFLGKLSAPLLGLSSEVTAFRFVHKMFSADTSFSNTTSSWFSDYINFASLKFFGRVSQGKNQFFTHALQDFGMLAAQDISAGMGLTPKAQGTFTERILQAEMMNWQMIGGIAFLHRGTGNRLFHIERSLETRFKSLNDSNLQANHFLPEHSLKQLTFSGQRPDPETYRRHQRKLLERDPERDFCHEQGDLRVALTEEELGHVLRWVSKGQEMSVSTVIRDGAGRLLVTYDRKSQKGIPRIPSGSVELFDERLEDVAVREMGEELGARVELIRPMAWFRSLMYFQGNLVTPWSTIIFEGRLKDPIHLPQEGELAAVEWVDPAHNIYFSMDGFFPRFDHNANSMLRSYLQRYPVRRGDLPWSDAESIHSLLERGLPEWASRSRDREYGAHRIRPQSLGKLQYRLSDGRILNLGIMTEDGENFDQTMERRIEVLEIETPGEAGVHRQFFYGTGKPSIAQILTDYRVNEDLIAHVDERLVYGASPHVHAYYRRHRQSGDLSIRPLHWNWREGFVEYQEPGTSKWKRQDGIFSRDHLDEFVGQQLRQENRDSFLEMRAAGVVISNLSLEKYLSAQFPQSKLSRIENEGEEAETFIVRDAEGQPQFIAKVFKRGSIFESPSILAKDQALVMWRAQRALEETALVEGIRYARMHALGPGWMIREYFHAENLGVGSEDISHLKGISQRMDESLLLQYPNLRFVNMAIDISLSSQVMGHNLAREILPGGTTRYVIYDPI